MLTLQVYQNKVLRLLTGNGYNVSTIDLCNQGGFLSINQIVAHSTLVSIYKIKKTGEPKYLAKRLGFSANSTLRNSLDIHLEFKLARGREGMLYRGSKLWHSLPNSLKIEEKPITFKKLTKAWIKEHIPVKPD